MIIFTATSGFKKIGNDSFDLNELIDLQKKAESILGNAIEFEKWLHNTFGNDAKLSSLLSTPEGLQTISNQLDLIAEGYPV